MLDQLNQIEQLSGLNDRVYHALKDAILKKVFQPGARLDITELAKYWGVSRTPVNDALQRLKAEGLVEVIPRKGTYVSRIHSEDVLQMLDVRLMFELHAAEQVVLNVTSEQLDELRENLSQSDKLLRVEPLDYIAYTNFDIEFHTTLIVWTGNRVLLRLYESQHFLWHTARFYYFQALSKALRGQQQHWEMYRALENHDLSALKRTIMKHINEARQGILGMCS